MKRWLIAAVLLPSLPAFGDTVFLKNGAWIDGKVTVKTETFIELQIGSIGKIQLPVEDIHSIERNSRTGRDTAQTYVEPKVKAEVVGPKPKERPPVKVESHKAAKDEKAPAKATQKAHATETAKPGSKEAEKPSSSKDEEAQEPEAGDEKAGEKKAEADAPAQDKDKDKVDPELRKRIEELVEELKRERSRNRVQAERHLEAIGQPAIPFLLPLAQDENELVRIAVMRLFHSFGDQKVIDAAIRGLLDESEYVREYANKTLKRVTGEDFGFGPSAFPKRREIAYQKWLKWWEEEEKTLEEERKLSEKSG